ncbi:MAG: LCP family protein [Candidatus Margulisiibacteriota bacterium]|nr:LCP family protein [Candidatus Margulisiibacteriota bacterium]
MKRKPLDKKIIILRLLMVLAIVTGILYYYAFIFAPGRIPFPLRIATWKKPVDVLILGTDISYDAETHKVRKDLPVRSDTMIIMHYDPSRAKVVFLSVPRDTYVNIEDFRPHKINVAFARGGKDLTLKSVNDLTGLDIKKYVIVNTRGLIKLVDLVGGVEVDVPKDLYYVDRAGGININLKKGPQKLGGKEAEGFVRFRMDIWGDIGRIERQQMFLNAFFKAACSPLTILKAPFILKIITANLESDLSLKDFIILANTYRMGGLKEVKTFTVPGEPGYNEVGSVWLVNKKELSELISANF